MMLPMPVFRRPTLNPAAAAPPEAAGVEVDAASSSASSSAEASRTWEHTCTGTNLKLLVAVARHGSGTVGEGGGDVPVVSGVTYNGVALTQVAAQLDDDGSGFDFQGIDLWYLDSPATGAHNVIVSVSPDTTVACGAVSFTGAAAGSPTTTLSSNHSSANADDYTNTAEGVLTDAHGVLMAMAIAPATSATAAGDCVERVDEDGDALGSLCWMATVTGVAGSGEFNEVDVGATFATGSAFAVIAVVVEPAE